MSDSFAELDAGYYVIRSIAADDRALAGVGIILPTSQPVRIDAEITIWRIARQDEPGVYRLSLKESYQYTGVAPEGRNVIATTEESKDQAWRIKSWRGSEAFTIELNTLRWPTSTWTLSRETPDIVIGNYELEPDKSQLFRIEPA